jgi:hypothetical protein
MLCPAAKIIVECQACNTLSQQHDGHFSNASGVDVRAAGFGQLSSMLYFKIAGKEIPVYRDFANNMTAAGWELDVTARGAAYDWRYDPGTLMDTGYAEKLQACFLRLCPAACNSPARRRLWKTCSTSKTAPRSR